MRVEAKTPLEAGVPLEAMSRKQQSRERCNDDAEGFRSEVIEIREQIISLSTSASSLMSKLNDVSKRCCHINRPMANGNKISDAEFTSEWGMLKFNVRQLARQINGMIPTDYYPTDDRAMMKHIFAGPQGTSMPSKRAPDWRRYSRWVVEKHLWLLLCDIVFEAGDRSGRSILKRWRRNLFSKSQKTTIS